MKMKKSEKCFIASFSLLSQCRNVRRLGVRARMRMRRRENQWKTIAATSIGWIMKIKIKCEPFGMKGIIVILFSSFPLQLSEHQQWSELKIFHFSFYLLYLLSSHVCLLLFTAESLSLSPFIPSFCLALHSALPMAFSTLNLPILPFFRIVFMSVSLLHCWSTRKIILFSTFSILCLLNKKKHKKNPLKLNTYEKEKEPFSLLLVLLLLEVFKFYFNVCTEH